MHPSELPHEPPAPALPDLEAAGRRLVEALRDQLADGQVEQLMSVQAVVGDLKRAEAALADTAQRAQEWNANAERALEWVGDEIGKRLEAATALFHAQATATERALRDVGAELAEQVRAAGREAASQVEQALAEAARALAEGVVEAEYRIAVAREQHLDQVDERLLAAQDALAKPPAKRVPRKRPPVTPQEGTT